MPDIMESPEQGKRAQEKLTHPTSNNPLEKIIKR